VYRDQAVIDSLEVDTNGLADPDSANPDQQPEFAVNPWRFGATRTGCLCWHLHPLGLFTQIRGIREL
jgi:hypothetical protein